MSFTTRSQCGIAERLVAKYAEIDSQAQSPLFGKLSPELRNRIFGMALQSTEDLTKPLRFARPFFRDPRPGDSHKRIVSIALLLTCRKAYMETYRVIININEHTFWFGNYNRYPLGRYNDEDKAHIHEYFKKLTRKQRLDATSIHIHLIPGLYSRGGHNYFNHLSKLTDVKHLRISIGVLSWGRPPYQGLWSEQVDQNLYSDPMYQDWFNYRSWKNRSGDPEYPPMSHYRRMSFIGLPLAFDLRVRGFVDSEKMEALIQLGDKVEIEKGSIASGLMKLKSLETLTVEFDSIAEATLICFDEFIENARTWVLPRKPKAGKVQQEMRVLAPTEIEEWKPFDDGQEERWRWFFRGPPDNAVTMRLKWVLVPKVDR